MRVNPIRNPSSLTASLKTDTGIMDGKHLSKVSFIRIWISFNCIAMGCIRFELMWKYLSVTSHSSKPSIPQQKHFQGAAHGHEKLKLKLKMAITTQNSGSSLLLWMWLPTDYWILEIITSWIDEITTAWHRMSLNLCLLTNSYKCHCPSWINTNRSLLF